MSVNTDRPPSAAVNQFGKVCEILDQHGRNPAKLIPILQAVQEEYRYLPREILAFVATSLDLPPARVYGVATFYSHFALAPKGKHVVRVCDGPACHVKGSMNIYDAVRDRLKLDGDVETTPDMLFTIETVSCLGACGLAPVMVIGDKVYGQVTPEKAVEAVEDILAKEG
jgi:NADH-quinone oxidoreductase subunit E